MNILQSVILGVLQGCTEFLPISSSGHLVLAKAMMHVETGHDASFEIATHFGTLLSVLLIFRSDILRIALSLGDAVKHPRNLKDIYRTSAMFRLACFIFVACIPAGILGVLFDKEIESIFDDVKLVSDLLLVTGLVLFITRLAKQQGNGSLTLKSSIVIGCAQAVAILPGISRTGLTISSGLMAGVAQEQAARFSFLMAIPVIGGAAALKVHHMISSPPSHEQLLVLSVGMAASGVAGYVALRLLLHVLRRGKFSMFSYYCFAVGILGIVFID